VNLIQLSEVADALPQLLAGDSASPHYYITSFALTHILGANSSGKSS
jgi:hypothetical protein